MMSGSFIQVRRVGYGWLRIEGDGLLISATTGQKA